MLSESPPLRPARANGVASPPGGAKRVLLNAVPGESSVWAFAMMSSVEVVVGSQRSEARRAPVFLPFNVPPAAFVMKPSRLL